MVLFGILEDSIGLHILHWVTPKDGSFLLEPLFYSIFKFLAFYFNSVYLYNFFVIFSWSLLIIFSYYFFNRFFQNHLISKIIALVFSFSPYFYYQMQTHLVLVQIWIVLIHLGTLVDIFSKNKKVVNYFFAGIILGFISITSNYLGYFSVLVTFFYFLINWFFQIRIKDFKISRELGGIFVLVSTFVFVFWIFNYEFIGKYLFSRDGNLSESIGFDINRPIEDFFIFSSRPWYYFLPSVDNPFLGFLSKSVIYVLQNHWGNFLANNYFKSEHSASFLGIVNLFIGFVGIKYLLLKSNQKNNTKSIEKSVEFQSLVLGLVGLVLVFLSMPPYITFFDFKLYLPSFLLYEFFPMFRVLSRIGVFTLLIWLIFVGFGYKKIYEYLESKKFSVLRIRAIFLIIGLISMLEFFIPFKFVNASEIPEVYKFLRDNIETNQKIVIYPHSKNKEAYFWSKDHQNEILNITGSLHNVQGREISNIDFTKNLITCIGIVDAKNLGASYLIYFPVEDEEGNGWETFSNLEEISIFEKVSQPQSYSTPFWSVSNIGNNISNTSVLYRIPENLVCNLPK
jgi:hypothetical protein